MPPAATRTVVPAVAAKVAAARQAPPPVSPLAFESAPEPKSPNDAVATVVMQGSGARVRDVLVAGAFRKRDSQLLRSDLAAVRAKLSASGERILGRLNVPSIGGQIAAK